MVGLPAIKSIVYLIHDSEILAGARGYIEARFPGTRIEYLIGCEYCLGYWASALVSFLFLGWVTGFDLSPGLVPSMAPTVILGLGLSGRHNCWLDKKYKNWKKV